MSRAMRHRGVEGQLICTCDICHLGSRDLFGKKIPRTPACYPYSPSGLSVVCDARLDNRAELTKLLKLPASAVTQQILEGAYSKWGSDCVDKISGEYVFIVWDEEKQEIFCARDPIGVKVLHYAISSNQFLFATEAQAIAETDPLLREVNDGRVADYLLGIEYYDFESSFYQSIRRLPPGHKLTVSRSKHYLQQFWKPEAVELNAPRSDESYYEEFEELLALAVAERVKDQSRVGCLLSGGLDSASIYSVAQSVHSDVLSYSVISDDPDCGDTRATITLLNHFETSGKLVPLHCDASDDMALGRALDILDDPFASYATLTLHLLNQARQDNRHVILDGVEGDLVISLRRDFPAILFRRGLWIDAVRESKLLTRLEHSDPFFISVTRGLFQAFASQRVKLGRARRASIKKMEHWLNDSMISPGLKARTDLNYRYAQLYLREVTSFQSTSEYHAHTLAMPYIAVCLERYDRVAAACGVDLRHPILDRSIVEFCIRLPWHLKVRAGWNKWIMRQSIGKSLPKTVAWRTDKPHLGWQFTAGYLKRNWNHIVSQVQNRQPYLNDYIHPEAVDKLLPPIAPEAIKFSDPWDIYQLSNWLQRNLHHEKSAPLPGSG